MKKLDSIVLYIRHISFIAFLISGIILYPAFLKYQMGKACLIMLLIYTVFTFIMIFIKNKVETYSIINNMVICFLHFYVCFVAYRYLKVAGDVFINNINYFNLNFLIFGICMLILIANKLLLASYK